MKVWIFNNYNMLPSEGGMNRHYWFAKCLQQMGHKPVVFVGSHLHNTKVQMISGREPYLVSENEEATFPWIYVRTCNYQNSKLKRIWSMFQYYYNAKKAAAAIEEQPNVIIGSSAHPLAAVLSIRLARKHHCKAIVEIRDLWPESIVAYGIAGPHNPAVVALRWLEKWIYRKCDQLIFTCEGAYNYIIEQGWETEIPRSKVHYINNGVDLETFQHNRDYFRVEDSDLEDSRTFKVIYTGSIRRANNLGLLLDTAKEIKDSRVKFLIWGDGDERPTLEQRVKDEGITNVVFKGRVDKRYIPSIVSRADLNFIHMDNNILFRYGISPNKLFDYFAAGKPVLMDLRPNYNPADRFSCGLICDNHSGLREQIEKALAMPKDEYAELCRNSIHAAAEYDFKKLTQKLIEIVEG